LALCVGDCEVHDINTRHNHNLHLPSTNLSLLQKGVLFSGSKLYNHLPLNIKMLSKDTKHFKSTLRTYLTEHAFYSLEEYTNYLPDDYDSLYFLLLGNFLINYKKLFNSNSNLYCGITYYCNMTNAWHTYVYCVTHCISVKIYRR
jgi:hypothetical protein